MVTVVDSSPRAHRLAAPRWLDGRLVLGVILVLLAVVAGARVLSTSSRYTPVYVARHALSPGEHLSASDLGVGRVRFDGEGGRYVAASRAAPVGYVVTRYVGAGDLLPLDALSASPARVMQSRFVTVPVEPGHLPADLGHGDLVDVYVTTRHPASSTAAAPSQVLAAVPVDSTDAGSEVLGGGAAVAVVLAVPASQVAATVQAVESGTIDLVRVPAAVVGESTGTTP